MGLFADLWGTVKAVFQIEIGGVKLKNSSGNLLVRNAADNADAEITASKLKVSGDVVEINSDAAEEAADWKYTLQRPATGMTADVALTLPADDGSPNQVLQTDGNGNLSFASAGTTSDLIHTNSTPVNYNDASPVALFTLPANAVFLKSEVIIDTPFNAGSPTGAIGIAGTTSKYMGTGDINLKGIAKDRYVTHPGEPPSGSPEDLIFTFNKDTATAGDVRVLVHYSTPA